MKINPDLILSAGESFKQNGKDIAELSEEYLKISIMLSEINNASIEELSTQIRHLLNEVCDDCTMIARVMEGISELYSENEETIIRRLNGAGKIRKTTLPHETPIEKLKQPLDGKFLK